ncbi:putative UDP-glucuronosyltransferase 2A3 [Truncatella angustata]|uniref:UDP-glucuronosyltransferase 2A3 n=1 Tax=Truncatella angustata TaxID=152316 RepID=A0A9P8ZSI6_9PEZI|nr:putative UDP-glucuronosyltransferase 2A3 [Truncatella angustata]KAH6648016.1 putative UDP-glucuronosyltransferase 2A3 [Truncatella angustata]
METLAKPLIVLTCTPGEGHANPIKTIAKALVLEGYEVTAVSASAYRKHFEDAGCSYVSIQGYGDYADEDRDTKWPERAAMPPGPEQFAWTIEQSFVRVIPDQFAAVQTAITMLREKHPGRPVVVLNESAFLGSLPLMKGAKGVKPDGFIGIGINPISLSSVDTAPFGPGLLPPKSPSEVAQYAEMFEGLKMLFSKAQAVFDDTLRDLGGESVNGFFVDAPYLWPDRFLQMCPPSMMYPRSDAPSSVRFAGGMPKLPPTTVFSSQKPAWWSEVANNPAKKDIVFVCQGTVRMDWSDIVVPTMEALKDRPNTLVVVALGKRGATLDSSILVPENARVTDYLPFDDILPFSSVFVGNGGYGGVRCSLAHGTPLVVAGDSEDKPEMCAIIEWAGVAVNLRTGNPTSEALRAGIDKVLSDLKYRGAAQGIKKETETFDPIRVIAENIDEVVAGVKA